MSFRSHTSSYYRPNQKLVDFINIHVHSISYTQNYFWNNFMYHKLLCIPHYIWFWTLQLQWQLSNSSKNFSTTTKLSNFSITFQLRSVLFNLNRNFPISDVPTKHFPIPRRGDHSLFNCTSQLSRKYPCWLHEDYRVLHLGATQLQKFSK